MFVETHGLQQCVSCGKNRMFGYDHQWNSGVPLRCKYIGRNCDECEDAVGTTKDHQRWATDAATDVDLNITRLSNDVGWVPWKAKGKGGW